MRPVLHVGADRCVSLPALQAVPAFLDIRTARAEFALLWLFLNTGGNVLPVTAMPDFYTFKLDPNGDLEPTELNVLDNDVGNDLRIVRFQRNGQGNVQAEARRCVYSVDQYR